MDKKGTELNHFYLALNPACDACDALFMLPIAYLAHAAPLLSPVLLIAPLYFGRPAPSSHSFATILITVLCHCAYYFTLPLYLSLLSPVLLIAPLYFWSPSTIFAQLCSALLLFTLQQKLHPRCIVGEKKMLKADLLTDRKAKQ